VNQQRSPRALRWFLGILIGLILIGWLANVYSDYLWMQSVDQAPVFVKIITTKLILAIIVGAIFFAWFYVNLRIARRPLPADVTFVGRRLLPDEERQEIEKYADRALLIFALVAALMAALLASGRWRDYLLFTNAVDFGVSDPELGLDVGFYVFKLTFWQYILRSLLYGTIIAFVVSLLVHLYQETIRLVGNTVHAMPTARKHLFSLLALALFIKIYDYRLMQFNLMYSTRSQSFFGASYADLHAKFPVLYIMMVAALLAGILLLVCIRQRGFKLAGWTMGVLLAVSLLAGSVYPALIQQLVVKPNELAAETKYMEHNIRATNDAYGLSDVKIGPFPEQQPLSAAIIRKNQETIKSIRLWDHRPLETTYDQQQGLRPYYKFADVDVDRYTVNGEYRQVMLSARQLNYAGLPPKSQTWVNRYLTYTHGYGLCMSPVHESANGGLPRLWIKDLPPEPESGYDELKVERAGLYYMAKHRPRLIELIAPPEHRPAPPDVHEPGGPEAGMAYEEPAPSAGSRTVHVEQTPYAIVNTKNPELDYSQTKTGQNVMTNYAGTGGVSLGGLLRRLVFAIRFKDRNILLTPQLKPESKIQMNRYVPDRLYAITPFPVIVYDPDPYLILVDGQLKWICDAYTISRMYPYSTRMPPELGSLNYMRNSVKVVVDAYNGKPTFYVFDETDPVLQCYRKIFPTLFTDAAQMPAEIRKHIRYPQLLFRVQAETYARYHMKDVGTFYNNEDEWAIPPELYAGYQRSMEAYYIILKLPGEDRAEFIQMIPLVLKRREDKNLVAWMAARSDAPNYGELLVYQFGAAASFTGPMQFEALVDQSPAISEKLSLWDQRGSEVIRGNTLVIPIEQSLLYVEPIYLVSTETPFPVLHRVVVATGNKLVMEPTLEEALAKLFGPAARVTPTAAPPTPRPAVPGLPRAAAPDEAMQKALRLLTEADQVRLRGDFGGYQRKVEEARRILEEAAPTR